MILPLVDIGLNLAHNSFDHERDAVVAAAVAAGVGHMVITGSTLESTHAAIAIVRSDPRRFRATAGIHPHHAREFHAADVPELRRLMQGLQVPAGLGQARHRLPSRVLTTIAGNVSVARAAPQDHGAALRPLHYGGVSISDPGWLGDVLVSGEEPVAGVEGEGKGNASEAVKKFKRPASRALQSHCFQCGICLWLVLLTRRKNFFTASQSRGPWDKLELVSDGIRKVSGQAESLSHPAAQAVAPDAEKV